jgi:hypothetical protein
MRARYRMPGMSRDTATAGDDSDRPAVRSCTRSARKTARLWLPVRAGSQNTPSTTADTRSG